MRDQGGESVNMRWRCDTAAARLALLIMLAGAPSAVGGDALRRDPVGPPQTRLVPAEYPSIQAAVDAAENGDVVLVGPGTYAEAIDLQGKGIEIRSQDGPHATTLDGAGLGVSIVVMLNDEPAEAKLVGFTLRSGEGTPFGTGRLGGAIFAAGAEATVSDCIFEHNEATGAGGAIAMIGCAMIIERCRFIENSAGFGDGGGAIWMSGSDGRINRCRFLGNSAGFYGGAISLINSEPIVANCLFTGNEAAQGGAIRNSASSPQIIHCTVAYNTADDDFTTTGGGMRSSLSQSQPIVRGSIFWGNEPSEIIDLAGAQTDVACSLLEGWSAEGGCGADSEDPAFIDPFGDDGLPGTGDENLRLAAASPAIDQGWDGDLPNWANEDLDGNDRFVDAPPSGSGTVDLGPFERQTGSAIDLDGDGRVNAQDLFYLLSQWGPCTADAPCDGDLTSDGVVNADDLVLLLGEWTG